MKNNNVLICIILAVVIIIFRYRLGENVLVTEHQQRQAEKAKTEAVTVIEVGYDCDEDGIDDQLDILQSAKDYVATHPQYHSKYYQTGYPDDRFGVCTDVVAFALKNAGYDLMYLMNEDIINYPDDYDIITPDINIDFRRVNNLLVYFSKYAYTLTTDLSETNEWQGGDIVVFKDHIGIVSDKRNERGVPYLIHHSKGFQFSYEQDVLEKRNDLVAHFRMP